MGYSNVKQEQEFSILNDYIQWINEGNEDFELVATPEPPDIPPGGIVKNVSQGHEFWVEVSTSYHSDGWAIDLNLNADPAKEHVAMSAGPYMNMDKYVAVKFVETLGNKLSKASYKAV